MARHRLRALGRVVLVAGLLLLLGLPPSTFAQGGFLNALLHPCAYNPTAIADLNGTLHTAIVGQSAAVQSTLQLLDEHIGHVSSGSGSSTKALVLSFHGMVGTGKTLLATTIAAHLYASFPSPSTTPSPHAHHFHGLAYDSARYVDEYSAALHSRITSALAACPLSMFIFEEVHYMHPQVVQHLLPLFSYHAQHEAASLTQAVYIFTSNIGGKAIQKAAFEAERHGLAREDIAYALLQREITSSFAARQQLSLLVEHAVVSRYVAFFPLFKRHVRQCVELDLQARRRQLVQEGAVHDLRWDDSVVQWVSSQLEYVGPVSVSGCKGISDLVTTGIVGEVRKRNRLEDAGWWRRKRWALDEYNVILRVKERPRADDQAEDGLAETEVVEVLLEKAETELERRAREQAAAQQPSRPAASAAAAKGAVPPVAQPVRNKGSPQPPAAPPLPPAPAESQHTAVDRTEL